MPIQALAHPQLDIIRVILEQEKVDFLNPAQAKMTKKALQILLNENGLASLPVTNVYLQLQNFTSSHTLINKKNSTIAAKTASSCAYPLHEAVREGNLEEVKKLVHLGYSVNSSDKIFKCTPLHMAAMYGHAEITAYLIKHGADVNATTYAEEGWFGECAYSVLDLAIKYEIGTQTLDILLKNNASFAYPLQLHLLSLFDIICDSFERNNYEKFNESLCKLELLAQYLPEALYVLDESQSFYHAKEEQYIASIVTIAPILKELSLPLEANFYQRMLKTIEIFQKADKQHISDAHILAKNLTHVFPSDKNYLFEVGDVKGAMPAEGHFSSITSPTTANVLSLYCQHLAKSNDVKGYHQIQYKHHYFDNLDQYHTLKSTIFKKMLKAYEVSSTGWSDCLKEASERLYQSYCDGEMVVIPTGWDGHAIEIILNKPLNLIMVANAGEQYCYLTPGLNAYNHKYEITIDNIKNILINTDKMQLEFKQFYDLGLTHNEQYSFEASPQLYGNCAWYSHQIAEKALIHLELMHTCATPNTAFALNLTEQWFAQLDSFAQTHILKEYLKQPSLEMDALADILVTYHHGLQHPEERYRAKLILDNLTCSQNKAAFNEYYYEHSKHFTFELKQFIKSYTNHTLSDDFSLFTEQTSQSVASSAISIGEVLSLETSPEPVSCLQTTQILSTQEMLSPHAITTPLCPVALEAMNMPSIIFG